MAVRQYRIMNQTVKFLHGANVGMHFHSQQSRLLCSCQVFHHKIFLDSLSHRRSLTQRTNGVQYFTKFGSGICLIPAVFKRYASGKRPSKSNRSQIAEKKLQVQIKGSMSVKDLAAAAQIPEGMVSVAMGYFANVTLRIMSLLLYIYKMYPACLV